MILPIFLLLERGLFLNLYSSIRHAMIIYILIFLFLQCDLALATRSATLSGSRTITPSVSPTLAPIRDYDIQPKPALGGHPFTLSVTLSSNLPNLVSTDRYLVVELSGRLRNSTQVLVGTAPVGTSKRRTLSWSSAGPSVYQPQVSGCYAAAAAVGLSSLKQVGLNGSLDSSGRSVVITETLGPGVYAFCITLLGWYVNYARFIFAGHWMVLAQPFVILGPKEVQVYVNQTFQPQASPVNKNLMSVSVYRFFWHNLTQAVVQVGEFFDLVFHGFGLSPNDRWYVVDAHFGCPTSSSASINGSNFVSSLIHVAGNDWLHESYFVLANRSLLSVGRRTVCYYSALDAQMNVAEWVSLGSFVIPAITAPGAWSFADWFSNNKGTGVAIVVSVSTGLLFLLALIAYLMYVVGYRRWQEAQMAEKMMASAAMNARGAGGGGRRAVVDDTSAPGKDEKEKHEVKAQDESDPANEEDQDKEGEANRVRSDNGVGLDAEAQRQEVNKNEDRGASPLCSNDSDSPNDDDNVVVVADMDGKSSPFVSSPLPDNGDVEESPELEPEQPSYPAASAIASSPFFGLPPYPQSNPIAPAMVPMGPLFGAVPSFRPQAQAVILTDQGYVPVLVAAPSQIHLPRKPPASSTASLPPPLVGSNGVHRVPAPTQKREAAIPSLQIDPHQGFVIRPSGLGQNASLTGPAPPSSVWPDVGAVYSSQPFFVKSPTTQHGQPHPKKMYIHPPQMVIAAENTAAPAISFAQEGQLMPLAFTADNREVPPSLQVTAQGPLSFAPTDTTGPTRTLRHQGINSDFNVEGEDGSIPALCLGNNGQIQISKNPIPRWFPSSSQP